MATEFGKILRIIRINSGDTAKAMADKLGISVPYLNAIENGRRDIPSDLTDKVINVYSLSEKDQKNIKEAVVTSKDKVKIDLTELAEKKRRVILALAQDEIDDDVMEEICKMVNAKKETNNERTCFRADNSGRKGISSVYCRNIGR